MSHDDPFAGKTVNADWAYYLDTPGTYTPELFASSTDPNLGADGSISGHWHRNGHLITAWIYILFSGTGLSPGSGIYEITLPFDADTSIMTATSSFGRSSTLGSANLRDNSSVSGSTIGSTMLSDVDRFRIGNEAGGTNRNVADDEPFTWAEGDSISAMCIYMADPSDLPT